MVVVNDPIELSSQDHLHDQMMNHALNKSINQYCEPMLHQADLQKFLTAISGIEVELSQSASDLLKAFYIASRKVRVSTSYGTDIPIRALSSLYVDKSSLVMNLSIMMAYSFTGMPLLVHMQRST